MQHDFSKAIRFDAFMHHALYDPHNGYYTQAHRIFGAQGDFVTAPELSPLFGATLALGLSGLLAGCHRRIIEVGAGRGRLAADLLANLGPELDEYLILEVSGGLAQAQADWLKAKLSPDVFGKVKWIKQLPQQLQGIVLGNEVLDAMPVRRFRKKSDDLYEEAWVQGPVEALQWVWQPAPHQLSQDLAQLEAQFGPWPPGYTSEIHEQMQAWVRTITERLNGVALQIDYGYHAEDYYSPRRSAGTLRATRAHIAHDDVLLHPGQQDLTAHVNFSACYEALTSSGGQLEGYCTQADLLISLGILDLAQAQPGFTDPTLGAGARQALNTLLSEAHMGTQFKAMAWSRKVEVGPSAFTDALLRRDLSGAL